MCYISICIPTNGRLDVLKKTLESIYEGCIVPFSDFEVVIADNATNDDLKLMLNEFIKYPNLKSSKSNVEGYLNSIQALKLGKGKLLKLHNNYTMFLPMTLFNLVELVKREEISRPIIYFKNLGHNGILEFNSFDDFTFALSYWHTWSTGISIWRDDFIFSQGIDYNKMFPHLSLLLSQNFKKKYIIEDTIYFEYHNVANKGGYNLFRTFAVEYLEILERSVIQNAISIDTFNKIKTDLFLNYLPLWYFNTKIKKNTYTFDLSNIKESVQKYYGISGYYKLIFLSYCLLINKIIKRLNRIKFGI
jgi:hypothetical protein